MAHFVPWWTLLLLAVSTSLLFRLVQGQSVHDVQKALLGILTVSALWQMLYWLVLYPNFFTPFRHLPTPKIRRLLTGNDNGFFNEPKWIAARRWSETVPNNGLIRYYTTLSHEQLLVTSPAGLAQVMVHNLQDYDQMPLTKFQSARVTGNGLQFLDGETHKVQRKQLMPAFTPGHIKTLIPIFWDKTVQMIHSIEDEIKHAGKTDHIVHITSWSVRVALDIIGIAGMDFDFDTLRHPDNEHKELSEVYRKIMSRAPPPAFNWIGVLLNFVDHRMLYWLPEKRNSTLTRSFWSLRRQAGQIIEARKEKLPTQHHDDKRKDIVSMALRSGMFSTDSLLDHVMTSIAVGHITTSITFDWCIYQLGLHPEWQDRLRREIRSAFPNGMEDTDAANIESLPWLNAICSETLRYYPPLPMTTRVAVRDTKILDTLVPKGTTVVYCADAVNHDVSLWGPDAHAFNPERWMAPGTAASGGAISNYANLTFSAGPKNCIGQAWERAELACLVAAMVGRFQVEITNLETAAHMEPVLTMMSKEGVYAKLKVLEGW